MDNQEIEKLVEEIVESVKNRIKSQGSPSYQIPIKNPPSYEEHHSLQSKGNIGKLIEIGAKRIGKGIEDEQVSSDLAQYIDHTLLKADATKEDIIKLCEEAKKYKFASVCVNPANVEKAAKILEGSGIPVCAVVGFPLGASSGTVKAFEAREAIRAGAKEIDMVINIGALRSGDYKTVLDDITKVVKAAGDIKVKVILETCYLTEEQKIAGCVLAKAAGAAFVKTSTGFGTGGATEEDVKLMKRIVGEDMEVKASGGIRTLEDAKKMIEAGATRLGASASVAIVSPPPKKPKLEIINSKY